jgi:hypothetical protein
MDANGPGKCPKCSHQMSRDYQSELGIKSGEIDRESESAGVLEGQHDEANAKAQKLGIDDCVRWTSDGLAHFRNLSGRRKALKALGLYDRNTYY